MKGVIEIHNSNLRQHELQSTRVCELMAIFNGKVQALPQYKSRIRTIKSLHVHGSRVSADRLFKSLIPDVESSTPRLVVAVQARRQTTRCKSLVVFVKTLTGKSVTIVYTSDDTVKCVKLELRAKAHVPMDDQRIMYRNKQLACGQTVARVSRSQAHHH